ncbi:venom peptide MmKTx1-like [Episyrphus balteatus]|uniref:venom peptide MmKTx1-like n=1 Tax=Episyrphus balteatus TaxID=286459 RepID=UPI002485A3F9|nr:venom peptide MmKTx1-like [Episyrphus balteatus]
MKLIFSSLLLICIFAMVFGDRGCTFKGKSLKVGEKYSPPGKCATYTCRGNGLMNAVGCPSTTAPDKCTKIPQDNSKPYPECCESYKC